MSAQRNDLSHLNQEMPEAFFSIEQGVHPGTKKQAALDEFDVPRTLFFPKPHVTDKRVHPRQPIRSLAYVDLGKGNGGINLNIGEGGMALQVVMRLDCDELPLMRVKVAHFRKAIEVRGRIVWTSESCKLVGIRFVDLSDESLNLIREWISLESPARAIPEPPDASPEKIECDGAAKIVAPVESVVAPPAISDRWEIERSPVLPPESVANPATAATFPQPNPDTPAGQPDSVPEPEQMRTCVALPVHPVGPKLDMPQVATKRALAKGRLLAWVGALVLTSFAVGWLGGRGSLRGLFEGATSRILGEYVSTKQSLQRSALNITNNVIGSLLPSSPPSSQDSDPAHSGDPNAILPTTSAIVLRDSGLQAGKLVHRVEPIYPPDASAQRIEGIVKVLVLTDEEGNIKTVRVLSGPQVLASAVVFAVSQWRYGRTLFDGHPIETERQITVTFKLGNTPYASLLGDTCRVLKRAWILPRSATCVS
jgi:TonB family protein